MGGVVSTSLSFDATITTLFATYPVFAWPQWDKVMKIQLMIFVTPHVFYGKESAVIPAQYLT